MPTVAERFEVLLDTYRMPDGSKWTGPGLEKATDGGVTRAYISALRKGKVSQPSYDKLYAIAEVMGFPVDLWSERAFNEAFAVRPRIADNVSVAQRTERLFETVINSETGAAYTDTEVAMLSEGGVSEAEVAGIRNGEIESPTLDQIIALADAFEVSPLYFTEKNIPVRDRENLDGLSEQILEKVLSLPKSQRQAVLSIVENISSLRSSKWSP